MITNELPSGKILTGKLTKQHPEDAGLDIYADEEVWLHAYTDRVISTGLKIAVPLGHVGLIRPRSGLSVKHCIETGAGVIDSGYRGEVKVHLYNHGPDDFLITKDMRIAQLLTIPVNLGEYVQVDRLDDTERGEGGFGSTGK